MFLLRCTRGIIKYLFFGLLAFSLQCLATYDSDESSEESKDFFNNDFSYFTTSKRYIWEDWTVPTREPPHRYGDGGYSGGGDPTVFFVILGVGIVIFVVLLFLCKKARDETHSGSRVVTSGVGGTDVTISVTGSTDVTISVTGSATNNPSLGRPGIVRQTSEKPPDYATVTLGDLSSSKSPFPSVWRQKSIETPPPKYDENNPMFK